MLLSVKGQKIADIFPWGVQWPPSEKAGNYASEELKPLLAVGKHSYLKGVIFAGCHDGYANTSPVGTYAVNQFGLYDMGGNVNQWCDGWFDEDRKEYVYRGAAWDGSARGTLLSSNRGHTAPTNRFNNLGFRCVLEPVR